MLGNRLSLRGLGAPLETERGNKTALHETQHGRDASATRFSLAVAVNVGGTIVFMLLLFFLLKSVSSAGGTSHAVEKTPSDLIKSVFCQIISGYTHCLS